MLRHLAAVECGSVVLALDPHLAKEVAIKTVRSGPEGISDELRRRFRGEARIAAQLEHKNIVTIYSFGEYDDQPYIVMPGYVRGETLAQMIAREARLSLGMKLRFMEELCEDSPTPMPWEWSTGTSSPPTSSSAGMAW